MPAKAKKQNVTPTPKTFAGGTIIIKNIRDSAVEQIAFRRQPSEQWFTCDKLLRKGNSLALDNLLCGSYLLAITTQSKPNKCPGFMTLEVELKPDTGIMTIGVGLEC